MAETEVAIASGTEPPMVLQNPSRSEGLAKIESHRSWPILRRLSIFVTADIPVKGFRVRDLLSLQKGQIVSTSSPETEDVSLMANSIQLAWGEFEVVDRQLVVRLTRLA